MTVTDVHIGWVSPFDVNILLASSRGLSQLTASFIACLCQGIHTHALSSLTIKSISHTKCPKCSNLRLSTPAPPPPRRIARNFGLRKPVDCITCDSNNARQIFNCQRSDDFSCSKKTPKIAFRPGSDGHLRLLRHALCLRCRSITVAAQYVGS